MRTLSSDWATKELEQQSISRTNTIMKQYPKQVARTPEQEDRSL